LDEKLINKKKIKIFILATCLLSRK